MPITRFALSLTLLVLISINTFAQDGGDDGSSNLKILGTKTWTLKYAWGDQEGIPGQDYARNQLLLDQSLGVDISGEIATGLSISAHLDDFSDENLQLITITLDTDNWKGRFGDFTFRPNNRYTVYNKSLKGAELTGALSEFSATGVISRIQGTSASKEFSGNSSSDITAFEPDASYSPRRDENDQLVADIEGLEFYGPLDDRFDSDFMEVRLRYQTAGGASRSLKDLLMNYGLDYLYRESDTDDGVLAEGDTQEISSGVYVAITTLGEEHYLLLKREALDLLRDQIQDFIREYNEKNELEGDAQKQYPWNEGTDPELLFLEELRDEHVQIEAGSPPENTEALVATPLNSYSRRRFYDLGHQEIELDTVTIEVKLTSSDSYQPIEQVRPDLDPFIFDEEGILELLSGGLYAIRTSYNYTISENVYVLGLSIVQGSEKVYLNDELLERDIDYTIDYEFGIVILFREVTIDDVLRIDYETFRGGLGGFTEYKSNFYGVSFGYQPTDRLSFNVDLLQLKDSPTPTVDPERATTMPNTHTVTGFTARYTGDAFDLNLELAYNHDEFPFDNNSKANQFNQIHDIFADPDPGQTVFFAHRNGLTVYQTPSWTSYDVSDGLSGRTVYDIDFDPDRWFFATESGLTTLERELDPFPVVENWKRFHTSDGLPSSTIYTVFVDDDQGELWVGTDAGFGKISLDILKDEGQTNEWTIYDTEEYPEMLSDVILMIEEYDNKMYLGTDAGLMSLDPPQTKFETVSDEPVHDMAIGDDGNLYVATDSGVGFVDATGWNSPTDGRPAYSVAYENGRLWVGRDDGLYRNSVRLDLISGAADPKITALAADGTTLWIGSEADSAYELSIWRVETGLLDKEYPDEDTGIAGEDQFRYQDPDASIIDQGWAGRVDLDYRFDRGEVRASFERIEPSFTAIGWLNRLDQQRLSLAADYDITPKLSISASHVDSEQSSSRTVTDDLGLQWELGPEIGLDYTDQRSATQIPTFTDKRQRTYQLSVSERFLSGRLTLGIGYQQVDYDDLVQALNSFVSHNLIGNVSYEIVKNLFLNLNYSLPIKVTQVIDGNQTLNWSARWSNDFGPFTVNTIYSQNNRWEIDDLEPDQFLTGEFSEPGRTENTSTTVNFKSFQLGGLRLTPSVNLRWDQTEPLAPGTPTTTISGTGGLTGVYRKLNTRLSYTQSQVDQQLVGSGIKRNTQDELSLSTSYTGLKGITPRLEFRATNGLLEHPTFGLQETATTTTTAGLTWQLGPGITDNLSLSQNWTQRTELDQVMTTYSLSNTLSYAVAPGISSKFTTTGNYQVGEEQGEATDELSAEVTLGLDYQLGEMWALNFSISYITGVDYLNAEDSYNTFLASLGVITNF
ncbi:MAG: two-component regulator propeller domain-containing protein [Candidatus Bipolaricaulia bacterium]